MKENELRIGNYLDYFGTVVMVGKIELQHIGCVKKNSIIINCYNQKDAFKKILITEELLVKIGYKVMPTGTYLQPNSGNFIWFEKGLKCCIAGEFYPENIKYVHQLQNLYFALTNKELEIEGL